MAIVMHYSFQRKPIHLSPISMSAASILYALPEVPHFHKKQENLYVNVICHNVKKQHFSKEGEIDCFFIAHILT